MADVATLLADAQSKMNKAVEVAKDDFGAIRTGRAHPAMFNKIMVDYYGTYTALSQLASIQVPESRMAVISPFDKGAMSSIEKAIRDSDLGVNRLLFSCLSLGLSIRLVSSPEHLSCSGDDDSMSETGLSTFPISDDFFVPDRSFL